MKVIDISLPLYNGMWAYRPEWKNNISPIGETNKGDASTVYRFNVVSHTGTYIETSQHKLKNNKLFDKLDLSVFHRKCKVVIVPKLKSREITLEMVQNELKKKKLSITKKDYVIIASGYGLNESKPDYLESSPHFEPELTDWFIKKEIGLIGVDTPIIENLEKPYAPVVHRS
jgi:kynurenine formamidase